MIYQEEVEINIMAIDATFWVAVSFVIFFGAPKKITNETATQKVASIAIIFISTSS